MDQMGLVEVATLRRDLRQRPGIRPPSRKHPVESDDSGQQLRAQAHLPGKQPLEGPGGGAEVPGQPVEGDGAMRIADGPDRQGDLGVRDPGPREHPGQMTVEHRRPGFGTVGGSESIGQGTDQIRIEFGWPDPTIGDGREVVGKEVAGMGLESDGHEVDPSGGPDDEWSGDLADQHGAGLGDRGHPGPNGQERVGQVDDQFGRSVRERGVAGLSVVGLARQEPVAPNQVAERRGRRQFVVVHGLNLLEFFMAASRSGLRARPR